MIGFCSLQYIYLHSPAQGDFRRRFWHLFVGHEDFGIFWLNQLDNAYL